MDSNSSTPPANEALLAALRLHLADLSPPRRQQVAGALRGGPPLSELSSRDLVGRGIPREAVEALDRIPVERALQEVERVAELGARLVLAGDPAMPPLLGEIADPPCVLWVRGELPPLEKLVVAVVGARLPTGYGVEAARKITRELAELGIVVLSGGAMGVDGIAHETALEHGGLTVAVLGCGIDVAYPRSHATLFREVARAGAVVSEFPLGTEPRPHHFPVRNRILAGWARAVVVVEASLRSGSLITARLALDAGRDVLAVPGSIFSARSEGTNELLARGARPCRSAADLVHELRPDEVSQLTLPLGSARSGPTDPVLAALPVAEALSLEALAELTALETPALLARISEWEAEGRVHRLPGGQIMRIAG